MASRHQQETDDWITAQVGPRQPSPNPSPRRNVQDPMKYTKEPACGGRCSCSACLLTFLNVILVLCGAAILVFGILARSNDHWDNVCKWCNHGAIGVLVLGGVIILVALVGIAGALGKTCASRCMSFFYAVVMGLLTIAGLGAVVLVILLKERQLNTPMKDAWNSAVDDVPQDVCSTQDSLGCSGWETCCAVTCYDPTGPLPKGCPKCDNAGYSNHTVTCKDKINKDIDDYFPGLLVGTLVFFLVVTVCTMLSCKSAFSSKDQNRRDGYGQLHHTYA